MAIWEACLGFAPLGVLDDFFALGGDSLLALRLLAQMERAGHAGTMQMLYDYPTGAGLAAYTATLQWLGSGAGAVTTGEADEFDEGVL